MLLGQAFKNDSFMAYILPNANTHWLRHNPHCLTFIYACLLMEDEVSSFGFPCRRGYGLTILQGNIIDRPKSRQSCWQR